MGFQAALPDVKENMTHQTSRYLNERLPTYIAQYMRTAGVILT